MDELLHQAWLERCARRIVELDPGIDANEAQRIAGELKAFERTGAMTPEAAADFVSAELGRPGGRFERRATPRS